MIADRLRRVAEELLGRLDETDDLVAVGIGGSVARGTADRWSDLELGFFWREPVSTGERTTWLSSLGRDLTDQHDLTGPPWSAGETLTWDDVSVDLVHRDLPGIEHELTLLLDEHDPHPRRSQLASVLTSLIPLRGDEQLAAWKTRLVTYPEELRRRVVEEHLFLTRAGIELHRARRDGFLFRHALTEHQRRLVILLLALNRAWHPGYKRLSTTLAGLSIAPSDLVARFEETLDAEPDRAWTVMRSLIDDVLELIEEQLPTLDVAAARASFERVLRPTLADELDR
ncbi:MAG: DUF4037 domain-containing protein [Acidobacteriota bacterium]